MRSGKLRQTITIQEETVTKNGFGEEIKTWSDVVTLRAKAESLRSGEKFTDGLNTDNYITFKTRYTQGIDLKMRVLFNSRLFDIQSVINFDELDKELHLTCKEIING